MVLDCLIQLCEYHAHSKKYQEFVKSAYIGFYSHIRLFPLDVKGIKIQVRDVYRKLTEWGVVLSEQFCRFEDHTIGS